MYLKADIEDTKEISLNALGSVREIQNIGRYRKLNKNVIREAHIHFKRKRAV